MDRRRIRHEGRRAGNARLFPLRTESVLPQDEDALVQGITACACTRYPIVEGTLVLSRSGRYEALTDHLIRELSSGSEARVRRTVGLTCNQHGARILRWASAVGRRFADQTCRIAGFSKASRRAVRSIDGAPYWDVVDEPYDRFRDTAPTACGRSGRAFPSSSRVLVASLTPVAATGMCRS